MSKHKRGWQTSKSNYLIAKVGILGFDSAVDSLTKNLSVKCRDLERDCGCRMGHSRAKFECVTDDQ